MSRLHKNVIASIFVITILLILPSGTANAANTLILDDDTDRLDLYDGIEMVKDRDMQLELSDVTTPSFKNQFVSEDEINQRNGFFETANWIRFELENKSNQTDWLLEFAFPLVYELDIYRETNSGFETIYQGGAVVEPFHERDINHRFFAVNIDIEPSTSETFYARAVGGGDLHPPIYIWSHDAFFDRTQSELTLLGIFYGIIIVMIVYNLFLYFSLKMRSYLYYVIAMLCTLLGKISINGVGFQYLWSDYPAWNLISTPFWVSLGCIFVLLFTRAFLDVDQYLPKFNRLSYLLIALNIATVIMLFISHIVALNMMIVSAFLTFITVLIVAFICLKRGARQARFYILGWMIFLTGVFITILERAAILPYSLLTEYAGQAAMTVEVVLLSFALADKINLMRAEKEEAEKQARESQELAMENLKKADVLKDEFLAVTSHELRTPIYGMVGIAESLRDGIAGGVSEQMKQQLSTIVASGNRLTHLVNDILDFSKLKYDSLELQLKSVHVKGVIEVVVAVSKPLIKNKPIELVTDIPEDLSPVYADPNRIQQILYNLVGNAIKYTDEGRIVISAYETEDGLTISVQDTGSGISADQLEYIFNPFQQADPSTHTIGGTGMGLSITKRLVDLHEGSLSVESQPKQGSTFYVTLPVQIEDTAEEVAKPVERLLTGESAKVEPPKIKRANQPSILVADDEAVNLQVLTNQLALEGYEVVTASDGEEVFDILKEKPIDLLILDLMMPKLSGYEVCSRLRRDYSLMELPILMLTAKSELDDKIVSFEAGANDYLVKPCDKMELLSRVRTLIRIRTLNQELTNLNTHLEEKIEERTEALKVANEDLKDANENLLEAEQSRRQMLSNIAHELGTPVTLIHSYMQSLKAGTLSPYNEHYNEQVLKKIQVLNRLITDLFDLSKLEEGKTSLNKTSVNVRSWLEQVERRCQFNVEQHNRRFHGINWEKFAEVDDWIFYIDHDRMDQVFSNLISNAAKYTTESDGEIAVDAHVHLDERHILIEITDNGTGINQEDLPYIFDRFYKQASLSRYNPHGTGLGLAIAKEIVESHKGTISVESDLNVGTTFLIKLPIKKQSVIEEPEQNIEGESL
ncbi:signal transduction histidine kinase [Alkalibacillus filiformis]|uniref:histidine kinase n=1 Tax=Alkalibacillus filiformis TaxID=200990 RepID=A0ABU0DPB8_9BACI|nr:ATP-binding protein [Alkalibacillus filiformis]MDQ0350298.1 signal transduction histidine kinase [Alkalibacillus filiformis]